MGGADVGDEDLHWGTKHRGCSCEREKNRSILAANKSTLWSAVGKPLRRIMGSGRHQKEFTQREAFGNRLFINKTGAALSSLNYVKCLNLVCRLQTLFTRHICYTARSPLSHTHLQ